MSIKLYVDPASDLLEEFTDSCSNLQTDVQFKRAVVTSGTWIFYTYPDYNNKEAGGTSSNYKILNPGADDDISSVNGSMYLVMDATEGILLFEHSYYGGTRKFYSESCANVNELFPSGQGAGVSSAIVLSQNQAFAIFTKINYQGLQTTLKPGMWCDSPQAMGFPNDKLQSLRKI